MSVAKPRLQRFDTRHTAPVLRLLGVIAVAFVVVAGCVMDTGRARRQARRSAAPNPPMTREQPAASGSFAEQALPSTASNVDLTPNAWSEAEFDRFGELNRQWGAVKPEAESNTGMVLATSGAFAARAGIEALYQGGTAADAALTTAFTQITLDAGAWNSYAGIASFLYYDADTRTVVALDAGFNVPQAENDPLSIPTRPQPTGRSALVPGFMAGAEALHQRFGTLPWGNLFDPAIYVARSGVEIDAALAGLIERKRDVLTRLADTRAIFTNKDGLLLKQGDLLRQDALTGTLQALADRGADTMYTGDWAKRFIQAVQAEGGRISLDDLARYEPTWTRPLHTAYHNYEIYAPGLPSIGAVHLLEAVNLLELADPGRFGHYADSAEALYNLMQITRIGPLVSASPPDYVKAQLPGISFQPADRVTKPHARQLWNKLRTPGFVQQFQGLPAPRIGGHSDGVIAIDPQGNVAIVVHTINTTLWGDTGIFVGGVSIPDSASFQQSRLAAVGPGGRVPNEMNPALVLQRGQPLLASAAIGGGLHEATLLALHNVLDFGMDPQTVEQTPMFLSPIWGPDERGISQFRFQAVVEHTFEPRVLREVGERGQPVKVLPRERAMPYRGYWIGAAIDPLNTILYGAVCQDLNGYALGM